MTSELIMDSFAGGGGASTGIELALGRSPDVAINHDAKALAMHRANHPGTFHVCKSVWDVDPRDLAQGRPVGLAWFSPDCTHFSKARGGKPADKNIRDLAWVVIDYARKVRPRVIILENVEEFKTWGPLLADNRPDPARRGETFELWLTELQRLGYATDWRELRACDYGAPTIRKRFFLIARCDGQPIVWPRPTHGDPRKQTGLAPWRTAAEIIDWSLPCPSIFDRKRPLAEKTLARIHRGIRKFVLEAAEPFVMTYYGQRRGGDFRGSGINEPIHTQTTENRHALVVASLAKHYGGVTGQELASPLGTVTAVDHHSLVAGFLTKFRGTCAHGQQMDLPVPTITASGTHLGEVRAFLTKYYGSGSVAAPVNEPLHTITARDRMGLVTIHGVDYQLADIGMRMLAPRELFRAQGFPDNYVIAPEVDGRPLSKADQVRMCGNSVCPQVAAALVRANYVEQQTALSASPAREQGSSPAMALR